MEEIVFIGQTWQDNLAAKSRWYDAATQMHPKIVEAIPFDVACQQIGEHFNCTPENAADSLRRNGYASEPRRHWMLKSETIQGVYDHVMEVDGERRKVKGDRW